MFIAAPLGLDDPLLDTAIKVPRLAARPFTRHPTSLQSEVNPDRSTLRGILPIHALDRISANLFEILCPAGGEIVQIKTRQPFRLTREGPQCFNACCVGPVPHGVDFGCRSVQPRTRLPFDL